MEQTLPLMCRKRACNGVLPPVGEMRMVRCTSPYCPCGMRGQFTLCPKCGAVNHLCPFGCGAFFHVSNQGTGFVRSLDDYASWPFDHFTPIRRHCINKEKIEEWRLPRHPSSLHKGHGHKPSANSTSATSTATNNAAATTNGDNNSNGTGQDSYNLAAAIANQVIGGGADHVFLMNDEEMVSSDDEGAGGGGGGGSTTGGEEQQQHHHQQHQQTAATASAPNSTKTTAPTSVPKKRRRRFSSPPQHDRAKKKIGLITVSLPSSTQTESASAGESIKPGGIQGRRQQIKTPEGGRKTVAEKENKEHKPVVTVVQGNHPRKRKNSRLLATPSAQSDVNQNQPRGPDRFVCKSSSCKELVIFSDRDKIRCTAKECPCKGSWYYVLCPSCRSMNHACLDQSCGQFFRVCTSTVLAKGIRFEDYAAWIFKGFQDHLERVHKIKLSDIGTGPDPGFRNRSSPDSLSTSSASGDEAETGDRDDQSSNSDQSESGGGAQETRLRRKRNNEDGEIDEEERHQDLEDSDADPASTKAHKARAPLEDFTLADGSVVPIEIYASENNPSVFIPTFFLPIINRELEPLETTALNQEIEQAKKDLGSNQADKDALQILEKKAEVQLRTMRRERTISNYKKVIEFLRVLGQQWSPSSTISSATAEALKQRYSEVLIQIVTPLILKDLEGLMASKQEIDTEDQQQRTRASQKGATSPGPVPLSKFGIGRINVEQLCSTTFFPLIEQFLSGPATVDVSASTSVPDANAAATPAVPTVPPSLDEKAKLEVVKAFLSWLTLDPNNKLDDVDISSDTGLSLDQLGQMKQAYFLAMFKEDVRKRVNECKGVLRKLGVRNFSYNVTGKVPIEVSGSTGTNYRPKAVAAPAPKKAEPNNHPPPAQQAPPRGKKSNGNMTRNAPVEMSTGNNFPTAASDDIWAIMDVDDDVLYRDQRDALSGLVRISRETGIYY